MATVSSNLSFRYSLYQITFAITYDIRQKDDVAVSVSIVDRPDANLQIIYDIPVRQSQPIEYHIGTITATLQPPYDIDTHEYSISQMFGTWEKEVGLAANGHSSSNTCQIYDPVTDLWATTTSMSQSRAWGPAMLSPVREYAYFSMGYYSGAQDDTYQYSVLGKTWSVKTNAPVGQYKLNAFSIGDKCYYVGAEDGSILYRYNYGVDAWVTKTAPTSTHKYPYTFTLNDKGYAAGGDNSITAVESYSDSTDSWTARTSFSSARGRGASFQLSGSGYASVGYNNIATTEKYSATTDSWSTVEQSFFTEKNGPFSYSIGNKGYTAHGTWSNAWCGSATEIYDSSTDTWSVGSDPVYASTEINTGGNCTIKTLHASADYDVIGSSTVQATLSPTILGTEGIVNGGGTNYTERYRIETDTWSNATAYGSNNRNHWMFGTSDGYAYIRMGYYSSNPNRQTWQYYPTGNSWTAKKSSVYTLQGFSGFNISDDLYTAGGIDTTPANQKYTFRYVAAWDAHQQRTDLTNNHTYGTGFALSGYGWVLGHYSAPLTNNERFNPTTNSWAAAKSSVRTAQNAGTFVIGSYAYLVCGGDSTDWYANSDRDNFRFDPTTQVWTQRANPTYWNRIYVDSFASATHGYISRGLDTAYSTILTFDTSVTERYDPVANSWVFRSSTVNAPDDYRGASTSIKTISDGSTYDINSTTSVRQSLGGVVSKGITLGGRQPISPYTVTTYIEGYSNIIDAWSALTVYPSTTHSGGAAYVPSTNYTINIGGVGSFKTAYQYHWTTETWASTQAPPNNLTYGGFVRAYGNYVFTILDGTPYSHIRYDVSTDIWVERAHSLYYKYYGKGYTYNSVGYLVGSGLEPTNGVQSYTDATQATVILTDCPSSGRRRANSSGFTFTHYLHNVAGEDAENLDIDDHWRYDTVTDSWLARQIAVDWRRYYASSFTIGNKGYLCKGENSGTVLSLNEEYDPTGDSWTVKTTSVETKSRASSATYLGQPGSSSYDVGSTPSQVSGYLASRTVNNGLIIGGTGGTGTNSSESYEPIIDAWRNRTTIDASNRYGGAQELASNGLVYLYCCYDSSANTDVYYFDSATDVWTQSTSHFDDGYNASSAVLGEYLYSQSGVSMTNNSTYRFSVTYSAWAILTNSTYDHDTGLGWGYDGQVYILGDDSADQEVQERYTPSTDSWETLTSCSIVRDNGTRFANGQYLHSLQCSSTDGTSTDHQRYDAVGDSFTTKLSSTWARARCAAFIHEGTAYIARGISSPLPATRYGEEYNFATESWTIKSASLYTSYYGSGSAVPGHTGSVTYDVAQDLTTVTQDFGTFNYDRGMLAGGYNSVTTVGILDVPAKSWLTGTVLPAGKDGNEGARPSDNKSYSLGGDATTATYQYDPRTIAWSSMMVMLNSFLDFAGFSIDEWIFAVATQTTFQRYHSTYDAWTAFSGPDNNHSAGSGITVNSKGYAWGASSSAKIDEYTPSTNTWTNKTDSDQYFYNGALVSNGQYIYGTGDQYVYTNGTRITQRYDTVGDSWSTVAALTYWRRYRVSSFKLADKGYFNSGYTPSALYAILDTEAYDFVADSWTLMPEQPPNVANYNQAGTEVTGARRSTTYSVGFKGEYVESVTTHLPGKGETVGFTAGNYTTGSDQKAESYHPSTDRWVSHTAIGSTFRRGAAYAPEGDFKAHIVHGDGAWYYPYNYDFRTTVWTAELYNFPIIRLRYMAYTDIGDYGYVYCGEQTSGVDRYDTARVHAATQAWVQLTDCIEYHVGGSGFALNDKAYAVGDYVSASRMKRLDEYTPSTDSWANKNSTTNDHRWCCSFSVGSYGYVVSGSTTDTVERFDGTNWTTVQAFPQTLYYASAFADEDYGYVSYGSPGIADLYRYNPTTDTWLAKTGAPSASTRYYVAACTHSPVTFGKSLTYDVSPLAASLPIVYQIIASYLHFKMEYHLTEAISLNLPMQYTIKSGIFTNFFLSYGVSNSAQAQLLFSYILAISATENVSQRYEVKSGTFANFSTLYDVIELVRYSPKHKYHINAVSINSNLSTSYHVGSDISSNLPIPYDLIQWQTASKRIRYHITAEQVRRSIQSPYDVENYIQTSRTDRYHIGSARILNQRVRYNVGTNSPRTNFPMVYGNAGQVSNDLTPPYDVANSRTFSRRMRYHITAVSERLTLPNTYLIDNTRTRLYRSSSDMSAETNEVSHRLVIFPPSNPLGLGGVDVDSSGSPTKGDRFGGPAPIPVWIKNVAGESTLTSIKIKPGVLIDPTGHSITGGHLWITMALDSGASYPNSHTPSSFWTSPGGVLSISNTSNAIHTKMVPGDYAIFWVAIDIPGVTPQGIGYFTLSVIANVT